MVSAFRRRARLPSLFRGVRAGRSRLFEVAAHGALAEVEHSGDFGIGRRTPNSRKHAVQRAVRCAIVRSSVWTGGLDAAAVLDLVQDRDRLLSSVWRTWCRCTTGSSPVAGGAVGSVPVRTVPVRSRYAVNVIVFHFLVSRIGQAEIRIRHRHSERRIRCRPPGPGAFVTVCRRIRARRPGRLWARVLAPQLIQDNSGRRRSGQRPRH